MDTREWYWNEQYGLQLRDERRVSQHGEHGYGGFQSNDAVYAEWNAK